MLEERWYAYDLIGNVELVIRKIAGDENPQSGEQWYRGTQLYYTKDGHLWMSRAVRWRYVDGGGAACDTVPPSPGCMVTECQAYAAMEYRYQGGRARYLVRPRDPETMQLYPYTAADGQWFDYDGEEIYGDLSVSYNGHTVTATNIMAHEPGLAQLDRASGALHHLHGNLIGSTEAISDQLSAISARKVYTAFGEPVDVAQPPSAVTTRYGYAGAYGYQSASSQEPADPLAELGWLHVGHRYYDPSSGRFVQRDPIGIRGGANVYLYTGGNPTVSVDPEGRLLFIVAFAAAAVLIITDTAEAPGPDDTSEAMRLRRQEQEKENFWAGLTLVATCVAVAPGAGGARAGPRVTEVVIKHRKSVGRDGGISKMVITRVNGDVTEVRHIVTRGGKCIHNELKPIIRK